MKKNENSSQHKLSPTNTELIDVMKHSFEFWHKMYEDSPLNYPLVWKKVLESNSELLQKIEKIWKNAVKQSTAIQMEQFLELWSQAIRKPNFEMAKKPIQEWQEFWENTTDEQFKIYVEVLQMLEIYWKKMQDKNIE